jgi:hypothetical protein
LNLSEQIKCLKSFDFYAATVSFELKARLERRCPELFEHILSLRDLEHKKPLPSPPKLMEICFKEGQSTENPQTIQTEKSLIGKVVNTSFNKFQSFSKQTFKHIKSLFWFFRVGIILVFLNLMFYFREGSNSAENIKV